MPARRWFNFALWFALFFMFVVRNPLSAIGFQPISPDELRMTSEPQAPGAPAIILFRQVDRDDNGHTSHEDNYLRIKVLTEAGRKYADVEIPFFKSEGNIFAIKARTIRPDGSVANFDGKVYEKYIAKAKGLKYLAKTFTLPDVQIGSILEYAYTIDLQEHYIYDSHWVLSDELFTRNARFSLKPFTSNYEPISLRWTWKDLPPGTSAPKEGPDRVVRLEAKNIPAFQTEDFMPPQTELKSHVDFIYSEEQAEKDPDKYWKKIGKKLNDRLESFISRHRAMEEAVTQIVTPSDSPEIKLQKIYARVQQIRNTSYEVRKSEQELKREKEKASANVEDVWKRGYGTGGDLTWLFLALVRAAGIEAHGVWASNRREYFFLQDMMDINKLNSNVVQVVMNGNERYFDPGAAFTPFGMLEWGETGVVGLRLDKDGGTWVRTTLPESSKSQVQRSAELKMDPETGNLEGKLTIDFTGLQAMSRRLEEHNEDETARKTYLETEAKEYIPAACDVELTSHPDWKSSDQPLKAEFTLKIPGWASAAGRRALVPVGIFSAQERRLFDHVERVHPIYIEFPFQESDDVRIEVPSGWQIATLPPAKSNEGHIIGYSLKAERDKNSIHLSRKLNVDFLLLETKYYLALRSFFQGVRTADEEQVVLQPGVTTASN